MEVRKQLAGVSSHLSRHGSRASNLPRASKSTFICYAISPTHYRTLEMEAVPPPLLHETSSLAGLVVMVMMGCGVQCVQVLTPSGAAEVQGGSRVTSSPP